MRLYKLSGIFLVILLLVFTFVTTARSASETASMVIFPETLVTQSGSINGALSALTALDQSGSDDTPAKYVSFTTPGGNYSGYKVFYLPVNVRAEKISSFIFQVHLKGPPNTTQTWSWSIYDWNTRMWHKFGDSIGANQGEWITLTFNIRHFLRYISPSREMRVRLQSNNASEDLKLDYEAIHITYIPIPLTPTRGLPTSIQTKPVLVLPTTITPSPTNTPTNTPTATITPSPTNTPIATNTPTCVTLNSTFEAQVLTLLNQERTSRGIPALTSNSNLRNAALGHTQDMACNDFVDHTGSNGSDPGDRIAAAGYDFSTWGENVAAGYTSPSSVVNAWMNSSGHRANILDPDFTEIGIGYVYNNDSTYGHYWTTDFAAP